MMIKAHVSKSIIGIGVLQLMLVGGSFAITDCALAGNTYDFVKTCPKPDGGKMVNDGRTYYKCECTSYAADKMAEGGVAASKYQKLHDASQWKTNAKALGVAVDTIPKVHDVAWFSGHVAYVESVDSKGNITVSEYNWSTAYGYGTRPLNKGSSSYPLYFIHFGAK